MRSAQAELKLPALWLPHSKQAGNPAPDKQLHVLLYMRLLMMIRGSRSRSVPAGAAAQRHAAGGNGNAWLPGSCPPAGRRRGVPELLRHAVALHELAHDLVLALGVRVHARQVNDAQAARTARRRLLVELKVQRRA